MFSKRSEVTISSISIDNMSPDDQGRFTLKLALDSRKATMTNILKLRGPKKSWENNSKGITKFTFDTGNHSMLQFDMIDRKGFLCFGMNTSYGVNSFQFCDVIEDTSSDGRTITETLPLIKAPNTATNTADANGTSTTGTGAVSASAEQISVTFTASIGAPVRGPCILALQAGPFRGYTIPEDIEQLWGPIPLPKLPQGVPHTCTVASHR